MENMLKFVAISGSLRKGSYNTMALQAAQKLTPPSVTIQQLSIEGLPLYNFDLYAQQQHEIAERLGYEINTADALIFVTPEYNYSIPGVLKNAIDFLSKHPAKPFDNKPVGIMSASPGTLGGVRAQYHLRQVMVAVNAVVLNQPEIMIAQANTKFDEHGNLIDTNTKEFISKFILSLETLTNKIKIRAL